MTSKTRKHRLSPTALIACLALFLALTGSAFAVGVAKNSVRSAQIVDGAVRTADLRDNAVKAAKVAPNAIGAGKIAENAVTSQQVVDETLTAQDLGDASVTSSEVADQSLGANDLGPDSVGASEIQANSVGTAELQSGAVRAADLAPLVVVVNEVAIKSDSTASASVACPAGTAVISGGFRGGEYKVHASGSYRSGNGWHLDARNGAANDTNIRVYAYCLSA